MIAAAIAAAFLISAVFYLIGAVLYARGRRR
jgi:hypothetical protein